MATSKTQDKPESRWQALLAVGGPTGAPVLARWAKATTMLQVAISLTMVALVISHAVGAL